MVDGAGDADGAGSTRAEVVVLGAGISGLVGTSVLLEQGAEHPLVLDEYEHVGGNHIDAHLNGYTFDAGSFIFQDDSPLLAHFPELLPRYEVIDPTWARVNPQGMVTEYPFSVKDDLIKAGPLQLLLLAISAVAGRIRYRRPRNAAEFAQRWLGARFVHRSGLDSYMARFCGRPIRLIDLAFAHSRMMWIPEHASLPAIWRRLRSMVGKQRAAPSPGNQQLARPREGFAWLYEPAVASLAARGTEFQLGTQLRAIRGDAREGFVIDTDAGPIATSRIISTIPLNRIAQLCGIEHVPLPTVRLISLFYSFAGRRGFTESILYNFTHDARWKRLTVYSDFYGELEGRTYFAVEVVAADGDTPGTADDEFRAHTSGNGLFEGDLRLEGTHVLTEAYPIYTAGSGENAAATVAALKAIGIESFGRQGAYKYQPTARVSTADAEAALR